MSYCPGGSRWRLHQGEDPHSGGRVSPFQWGALLGWPKTDKAVPRRPAHLHAHRHRLPAGQQCFARWRRDGAAPPGGGVWMLLHNHPDPISHHPTTSRPAQLARHRLGFNTQALHWEWSVREVPPPPSLPSLCALSQPPLPNKHTPVFIAGTNTQR